MVETAKSDNQNNSDQQKIKRIHQVYDEFLRELDDLKERRDEIVKNISRRQDEDKINKILQDIKNIKA